MSQLTQLLGDRIFNAFTVAEISVTLNSTGFCNISFSKRYTQVPSISDDIRKCFNVHVYANYKAGYRLKRMTQTEMRCSDAIKF
jgi:hypothetical protein